ncbi:aminotransferase class I/II-fold pyridoxal phosphate-dependent enzyme [Aestuariibaculum sediminum]|uniref:Aminotransferase class I/II-fold pyridoxal phosphate-dependent enzyme n=1 Tax=Aestuariibaculum sediminum TaxID=2770637 RepID=A0A8J6UFN8_9FLAO|nr:aminotransferase class I/II-fold pyridoxal phosphate-dependent enzyme [Aestuariibaculum sediminum]MBD0831511.1 aminotransferase class I/II-fold pyridoxal phosphate-dependent enzyme [Aestuariibaculum sediminum]
MAKIKPNNFLDIVDEVFTDATKQGVLHLYADGDILSGRTIGIDGKSLFHFGTTGYLGLEQDKRLKQAAVDAILRYGTQFPLSKTYVSHPLYQTLEERVTQMYGNPVIITKNSTLGHIGVIPSVVSDQDAIVLDHQVHWSVQNAAKPLKSRSVPIEMIRHNNLNMLEDKMKSLSSKHKKVWYMADGLYSMYGDAAPVKELLELSNKYSQLHLYFDDVHGMSWAGKHGTGYVMQELGELPEHVLVFSTLSKTFGASGAVMTCSNKKLHSKIKTFGGPLTFSAQLEPASVAAAIASADIHLSDEIYILQRELGERIHYFNALLKETDLPIVEYNESPVFYVGTGMPITGYNFVNRLLKEGFFVNLGLFPAVPVKNTGVRITISRHNQPEEIKALTEAMVYHYPKALEATHTTSDKVFTAFNLKSISKETSKYEAVQGLSVQFETCISNIDTKLWNSLYGSRGVFDYNGLQFLEKTFLNHNDETFNWQFYYLIIKDQLNKPVLATYFTYALWKEDMLAPESVSKAIEVKRKADPNYMCSYVLSMGSLFTEGDHLYLDQSHPMWLKAMQLMLDQVDKLDKTLNPSMIVFRDFKQDDVLNEFFHNHGYFKVIMPEAAQIHKLKWVDAQSYMEKLSAKSRRHFRKDIQPFESCFDLVIKGQISKAEKLVFYKLFQQVSAHNLGLNMFDYPVGLMDEMSLNPHWEFIILHLKAEYTHDQKAIPVGVMFCYSNAGNTYVPAFIGMDYAYVQTYQVYRQLLFQTIKRAGELEKSSIDFGLTAGFEKKKLGAEVTKKVAYMQAKDNFSLELMEMMGGTK